MIGLALHGGKERTILAGKTDCERAMSVDQSDKFTGNLARQNHTHHIHGLRRGDPQTSLEFRLNAQSLKHVRDLRASAMHHNRMQADLSQKHHIFSETGL